MVVVARGARRSRELPPGKPEDSSELFGQLALLNSAALPCLLAGCIRAVPTRHNRNDAVEMNGERSRLGCSSARPRAEHWSLGTSALGAVILHCGSPKAPIIPAQPNGLVTQTAEGKALKARSTGLALKTWNQPIPEIAPRRWRWGVDLGPSLAPCPVNGSRVPSGPRGRGPLRPTLAAP